MLNEIQQEWVRRLNSGEIKQGQRHLGSSSGERYCLGVLCDMAVEAGIIPPPPIYDQERPHSLRYAGEDKKLPIAIQRWAGMKTAVGRYSNPKSDDSFKTLAYCNDMGLTFPVIASVIEKEAKNLFVQPEEVHAD